MPPRKSKSVKKSPPLHPVEQYVKDILSGVIPACQWVKLACQRYMNDKRDAKAKGLVFDEKAAQKVIDFYPKFLRFYEGEFDGKPFVLEPWQQFLIWNLFGWKLKDGSRRFRTAYMEIAKGSGKTPLLAGIGLYGLIFDKESGAEIYCLDPSTPVLDVDLRWRPISTISKGDRVVAFDEYPIRTKECRAQYRKLRIATVLATHSVWRRAYEIRLANGQQLIAGEHHPWLCKTFRSYGWEETHKIRPGWKIRQICEPWKEDTSKEAGYLAGFFDGEGCYHSITRKRAAHRIGFPQKDGKVLDYVLWLLIIKGFITSPPRIQQAHTVVYYTITGLRQCLRFLGMIRPVRLLNKWESKIEGKALNRSVDMIEVLSVEDVGYREMVDIETSTRTFIANGFASHNSAAVTRDQAGIMFRDAHTFAETSTDLASRLDIGVHNIAYPATNSFFRPISSEHRGLDGKRPHMALIDEIHEHPTSIVVDKMRAGTKGRRQALICEITNSGYDRQSVAYQHHEYSEKVLQGVIINDSWFAYMTTLDVCEKCKEAGATAPTEGCPDCDDWRDDKVWIKANPNLGVSIKHRYIQEQVDEAINLPAKQNIVKRLNFGIWCTTPDTLVTMVDGSQRRVDTLCVGDSIISFDEITQQLERSVVTQIMDNGIQPVYEIVTARGRNVVVTGEHRFWRRYGRTDNPQYGWIAAKDMKPKDRVAIALGPVCDDRDDIVPEIAYILGAMTGDGNCSGNPSITGLGNKRKVIEACNVTLKKYGCEFSEQSNGQHWHVRQLKRMTRSWLIKTLKQYGMYGTTCYTKRVPREIFTGGKDNWAAFLSGYLDTDGSITKQSIIVWESCNKELLRDCQYLLALLGVQSSLNSTNNLSTHWRLEVRDIRSRRILVPLLTLHHPVKKDRLAQLRIIPSNNGIASEDVRLFDRIVSIKRHNSLPTIGVEVSKYHTHITNGFITHNTESLTKWLSVDHWNACNGAVVIDQLVGRRCYGGLDLSSTTDTSSLVWVFPPDGESPFYHILCRFFIPRDNMLVRVRKDRVPYDVWVREGYITATTGNIMDYGFILKQIEDDCAMFNVQDLAFDRWGSQKITTDLQNLGFEIKSDSSKAESTGRTLVQFGQGYASMSAPSKELEKMVIAREIAHGGNPVLAWMASNVVVESDAAGNVKPSKEKSTERIDGIVALVMAISRAVMNKDSDSIYEMEDVIVI